MTQRVAPSLLDPCSWPILFHENSAVFMIGRSSGFRIILLSAPSHFAEAKTVANADFVPDHSGGTAPGFNGIPF